MANALHTYLVTDTVPELADLDRELPIIRDDYVSGYVRQEQRCGLIGIYEQAARPGVRAHARARAPRHPPGRARRDHHTPDGETMLGPSGVPGFWMACGAGRVP